MILKNTCQRHALMKTKKDLYFITTYFSIKATIQTTKKINPCKLMDYKYIYEEDGSIFE